MMAFLRSKDIQNTFTYFDKGCKNKLNGEELICAIISLFGTPPSKVELKEIIEIATLGYINWPLFHAIVSKKLIRHNLSIIDLQIIRLAFKMFYNKDSLHQELISSQLFMSITKKHAPHLNEEFVTKAFLELDSEKDGFLNFTDFTSALRSDVP